jgi:hypothetical protein
MVYILITANIHKGNTSWETTDVAPTAAILSGGLLCLN